MKTTIDIPDELYRRVKARSALLGLAVREVTIDLYRSWLGDEGVSPSPAAAQQWVDEWHSAGLAALGNAPTTGGDPTTTEIIEADRARLDRS